MRRSILLIFLLTIPAFLRMLRPGIFSMQDFHLFRLYEFDRCFRDFQFPCRWAPDAGFGYGEPVFNFYTQVPYLIGEIFHLVGFQLIDSIKILFILTFVASAISMYFLARQIWKSSLAAILSAVVYLYAPYRAVDVWVRGALPEAMAFIIFPIIIFFINDFLSSKRLRSLILLSFSLALLLITHNLSFLMFMPVLIIWMSFLVFTNKQWKLVLPVVGSFIFALLISAFYILPVIFEGKFIQLDLTTKGYFDFRGHFTTVYQLLISRFWGYGASLFGPVDDISLSVGQIQWVLPLVALLGFIVKKKDWQKLAVFILIGWFALFMSHNKSAFVWENLPFLAYLQFPWRWLSIATFSFAIGAGGFALLFKNKYQKLLISGAVLLTVLVNIPFFKEDIWKDVGDKEVFSGKSWEEQIASSLPDYWPNFGKDLPSAPAGQEPTVLEGQGSAVLVSQDSSANREYKINIDSERGKVQFPVAFFPGWEGKVNGMALELYPSGSLGLITMDVPKGDYSVFLSFRNTFIRTAGNIISAISFIVFVMLLVKVKNKKYVK